MDSWPRSREVEKVKPFAFRAAAVVLVLWTTRDAVRLLAGHDTPLERLITDAARLLEEAIRRGVKGKDG